MHSPTETAPLTPDTLDGVTGQVIVPEDPAYDQARAVFYGGIDKRPGAIVRVANTADVQRVIAAARDGGYELAVRSGGHSIAGHSTTDGGIVLDLRSMANIEIDADARIARVETGAIDSLLAGEIVTAGGRHLCVDAEQYPDLFWAIRGGGGNFGVVTRLEFRLHELRQFTGGILVLPATPETIAGFAAASLAAPEELSTIGNVMPAPPLPFLPSEMHGRLGICGTLAYAGDDDSAQRAGGPVRAGKRWRGGSASRRGATSLRARRVRPAPRPA